MGKNVRINVEGFGTVLVAKPKKYNKETFADGVAEGVAGAVGLLTERDRTSFHPVLGKGGYDWDHEAQRTHVSETHTPGVSFREPNVLRFCVLWVRGNVLGIAEKIHEKFHKGDR